MRGFQFQTRPVIQSGDHPIFSTSHDLAIVRNLQCLRSQVSEQVDCNSDGTLELDSSCLRPLLTLSALSNVVEERNKSTNKSFQALSPIGFIWHLLEDVEVEKTHCPAVSPQNPSLINTQEVNHSWQ